MSNGVQHNADARRFELELEGGKKAFVTYAEGEGGVMDFNHTEVPEGFEGQGIAGKLVRGALEIAQAKGSKVKPSCPYVGKFIEKNSEFKPLLA